MIRSTDQILTTHTGSLPRPDDLEQMLFDREDGVAVQPVAFASRVSSAVAEAVGKQLEVGVTVVGDGEMGKIGYSTYVKDRLSGFDGQDTPILPREMSEFPEVAARTVDMTVAAHTKLPACTGPVALHDPDAVGRDIENLTAAVHGRTPVEVFMNAASPGVIASFLANSYYRTHEAYLFALADAMKPEYDAIAAAGFILQLDCPDLAACRTVGMNDQLSDDEFRDQIRLHVRALNHAVRDISPDRMRMHVCWGNAEWPHIYDIPLQQIVDIVLDARPVGLLIEAANPRHEHEWKLWEDVALPDSKILIPGVIDSTTNFVEHPKLVAQRLTRFAELVGKHNIIAGTDCGFATFAGLHTVHPKVTWLKLQALTEGARIASGELW